MSKRTVPDLKELFKQASEIAQQVPESMQEAAFNRAVDLLTGSTQPDTVSDRKVQKRKGGKEKASVRTKIKVNGNSADELLSAIDSTQHPGVVSASKVLDRSLMVLQIARTEHIIDGLTPSEIAKILTNKFRIRTDKNAVGMALRRATNLVDRIRRGRGFEYRIMGPGEEHVAHLGEADASRAISAKRRPTKKIRIPKKAKSTISPLGDDSKSKTYKSRQKKTKSGKSTGRETFQKNSAGPKAAVLKLIDSGFFSKGRSGPEVQAHLKKKHGVNFETSHLRMVMLRLVRDGKLDRDENADGQYEYKTATA